MNIIDVGDDRYLVQRELGPDHDQAKVAQGIIGGILIRDSRSNNYFLCEKIEEADIDEDPKDTVASNDS